MYSEKEGKKNYVLLHYSGLAGVDWFMVLQTVTGI